METTEMAEESAEVKVQRSMERKYVAKRKEWVKMEVLVRMEVLE